MKYSLAIFDMDGTILCEKAPVYIDYCMTMYRVLDDPTYEATEEELAIIRTYMTFGDNGLIIGKTGTPFTFRVVNDRLAFYMNDTEVAYLSNNKLYVTQADILTKLIIGKFAFVPQTNGNMSIVYNG